MSNGGEGMSELGAHGGRFYGEQAGIVALAVIRRLVRGGDRTRPAGFGGRVASSRWMVEVPGFYFPGNQRA